MYWNNTSRICSLPPRFPKVLFPTGPYNEGVRGWRYDPSPLACPLTGPQDDAYEYFVQKGEFPAPRQPFPPTYHQKLLRLRVMMFCWAVLLVGPWVWCLMHLASPVMMVEMTVVGCKHMHTYLTDNACTYVTLIHNACTYVTLIYNACTYVTLLHNA